MTSPVTGGPGIGLTTIPRAVLSAAAGMVHSMERAVVGDSRVRTSRSNAWEAMCADRDRARHRDEVRRMLAALVETADATTPAGPPKVFSPAPAPATAAGTTSATTTAALAGGTTSATTTAALAVGTAATAASTRARQVTVGSSPRSSASQVSRVSTGAAGPARAEVPGRS